MNAQRRLAQATDRVSLSSTRLSSGLRINNASDDAAGLSISSSLRTTARIFSQALRNSSDVISAINIADGSLSQLSTIVIRQRELAIQSLNGTFSLNQRKSMQNEVDALVKEFNRITQTTTFNGRNLIDGSLKDLFAQIGSTGQEYLRIGMGNNIARKVGTGTFGSTVSFANSSTFNRDIISADFNGDGIADIATASDSGDAVYVNYGNGDGTFGSSITLAGRAFALDAQDMNGDGVLDIIAVGSGGGTNNLKVWLSNGSSQNFTLGQNITLGSSATVSTNKYFDIADVNKDGIKDIVSYHADSGSIVVLAGNGNGTFNAIFTSSTILGAASLGEIELGDINGDGNIDIVTNSTATANQAIGVLLGNGNGSFNSFRTLSNLTFDRGVSIDLYDVNNDGILDLITNGRDDSGASDFGIQIRLGKGDGTFNSSMSIDLPGSLIGLKIGDFNNDGQIDILTRGSGSSNTTYLLTGNGNGTFVVSATLALGTGNTYAGFGDFNGDGVLDIIANNAGNSEIAFGNTKDSSELEYLNILTSDRAREALSYLDAAFQRINLERSVLGANDNRLKYAMNNLQNARENYLAADERISSVDVAEETSKYLAAKVLQDITASILAQANNQNKILLELIKS